MIFKGETKNIIKNIYKIKWFSKKIKKMQKKSKKVLTILKGFDIFPFTETERS